MFILTHQNLKTEMKKTGFRKLKRKLMYLTDKQIFKKNYLLVISLFILLKLHMPFMVEGQNNEYLLQINPENDIKAFIEGFNSENSPEYFLTYKELISKDLSIHLIENQSIEPNNSIIELLLSYYPIVLSAQTNKKLSLRKAEIPDDTLFKNQWSLLNDGSTGGVSGADINVVPLWNINKGGLTSQGDTIVVAVIDDGIDTNHPDIMPNLWFNYNEIPGNSIDDDGNGYVDDYRGWNTYQDNDNLLYDGSHGTQVSGIIGARGNNTTGIAGINWNVKIMMIVGGGQESDAIKAYSYVLKMRKLYNASNGQKGAYIVSTNTSWGLDNKFPKDAPIWCALYDSMGKAGILNVAATTNSDIYVDTSGDLPTTCPSKYLLTVSSTNKNDQKNSSGSGKISIDIGAPGKSIFTTAYLSGQKSDYSYFTGTSASSPHTAGVTALLVSASCNGLIELGKKHPDSLAYLIKLFIMQGVKPLGSLYNLTVTGGRLNAFGAYLKMMEYCNNVLSIEDKDIAEHIFTYPNPVTTELKLNINLENVEVEISDIMGKVCEFSLLSNNSIDFSEFKPGIYYLRVITKGGILTQKIIKI